MGIKRKKKDKSFGITLTKKKLNSLILDFLANHEADMTADYKPESEIWRKLLADALTAHIIASVRKGKS